MLRGDESGEYDMEIKQRSYMSSMLLDLSNVQTQATIWRTVKASNREHSSTNSQELGEIL